MEPLPHRISLVLEHVSATEDSYDGRDVDSWSVVAYMILDSGKRRRATLRRCDTREQAADALGFLWQEISNSRLARIQPAQACA